MNKKTIFKYILIFASVLILIPILLVFTWSFVSRWPWPDLFPNHFSLKGLSEVFGEYSKTIVVLFSSIFLSLISSVISTIIGFLTARALALYNFKGKAFFRAISMLPMIIPANIFAMGIHSTFIKYGLSDTLFGVVLCHVIFSLPYTINILLGVMENIGAKYEQQATMLGCHPLLAIIHISLPIMIQAICASLSMGFIISYSQYFLTMLIGGGKIITFSTLMMPFISSGDRTVASVYVSIFILSSLLIFIALNFISSILTKRGAETK